MQLSQTPEYLAYRQFRRSGMTHEAAAGIVSQMATDPAILSELEKEHASRQRAIFELSEPGYAAVGQDGPGEYDGSLDDDRHWPLFRDRLDEKGLGHVKDDIEAAADRVVSLLPSPQSPAPLTTRGLVLGYVQSGKTTNFTALIAKAADYGFQLFVVLAGVHNALRDQTQLRLEHDLLDLGGLSDQWWCPTSHTDFRGESATASYHFGDPSRRGLVVIKKNVAPMRKLNDWLAAAPLSLKKNLALLVIDDEADQASLNTGSGARKTAIHRELRRLLSFGPADGHPRVAYVGYTATPFANLLVDPGEYEDLYPRDFVVDLPKPDGYHGAEDLFGRADWDEEQTDGLPVIRRVPEHDVPKVTPPKDPDSLAVWEPSLPDSLKDALRWFLLASAARRVIDGRAKHSSMLVHTSSRTEPQCRMEPSVRHEIDALKEEWRTDRSAFRELWGQEMSILPASDLGESAVAFAGLEDAMDAVLAEVIVRVDNSRNCTERLSYPDNEPQTVVAIGGNTLSRGLTLEGLVVSYFLRAASAYDTLLQMGRWFGFRPGYAHLQRIWMTDELRSWFADLASVEEEIRRDIRQYEDGSSTPEDIAVRIRTHPHMSVTSAAKMRSAVVQYANYYDKRVQTTRFEVRDARVLENNLAATRRLLDDVRSSAGRAEWRGGRWHATGVDYEFVRAFLRAYEPQRYDVTVNPDGLIKHFDREHEEGRAAPWNVVVMGREDPVGTLDLGLDHPVRLVSRARMNMPDLDHAYIKALAGGQDHRVDVNGADPGPRSRNRAASEPPLLSIYVLDPQAGLPPPGPAEARAPLGAVAPVAGFMVTVPASDDPRTERAVSFLTADLSSFQHEVEDDVGDEEEEA